MHVAAGLLLDGTDNIRTVASRVGYRSEAASSIAFKRWAGVSPSGYRRRMLRAESENLQAPRSQFDPLQISLAILIDLYSEPDSSNGQEPDISDQRLQSEYFIKKEGATFLFQVAPCRGSDLSGLRPLRGFLRE